VKRVGVAEHKANSVTRKANVMKLKLMTKVLLLVGFLAGFAPVAQAFYNPDTLGSTFVSNSDEMVNKVEKMVPEYDPDGDCCKGGCISHLSISHHGAGAGSVVLSTDGTESFSLRDEYDYNRTPGRGRTLSQVQLESLLRNERALATLWRLGSKLCHGAKVSIVQCNSEFPAGPNTFGTLKSRLQTHFGNGVTVETFEGECGLRFGKPTTVGVQ
jgi:hypothetical protein